jgi:hypothetical protein
VQRTYLLRMIQTVPKMNRLTASRRRRFHAATVAFGLPLNDLSSLALALLLLLFACADLATADDLDEFKVKREEVYEFTSRPQVTLDGDRAVIRFTTKGYCDVTVAIEDSQGRIVRHLASGVLGAAAPPPLVPGSLEQTIVWDGKDDQGRYIDDKAGHTVRVSLGLRPTFEKTLYWSPYKRIAEHPPLVHAAPEGMYVFEGMGVDSLKLFDHKGTYVRTIVPFAADKLQQVAGLNWQLFPQDGRQWPLKNSLYQQTLLTSGDNANRDDRLGMSGCAATAMSVRDGRIALVKQRLNRLAVDGTTGGKPLTGPKTNILLHNVRIRYKNESPEIYPTSAAISPDGRWLYLTGYAWRFNLNFDAANCVLRMALDEDSEPEVFKGSTDPNQCGSGDDELKVPTSVDVDSQGRIYIADYMNDRIQVFDAAGKLLRSIAVEKPALIRLNRRTDELYVFTWLVCNRHLLVKGEQTKTYEFASKMRRFGPFADPQLIAEYDLPLPPFMGRYSTYTGLDHALLYTAEVDSWTDPPTIWLSRDCNQNVERGVHPGDGGRRTAWEQAGLILLTEQDGRLEPIRDFGADTVAEVKRARPPSNAIQRLDVNPVTGKLYVGEADSGATVKAAKQLLEIDPQTGAIQLVDLPFNAIEVTFDLEGQIYLRTTDVVVRYRFPEWREVPYDYGEQLPKVGAGMFGRYDKAMSGLVMPSASPVCFHQGGIYVSPKGHLVTSCAYRFSGETREGERVIREDVGGGGDIVNSKPYAPRVFPGRMFSSTGCCIHVWDKHGQLIYEDAVPGMPQVDGVAMDRDDNIYVMATPTRVLNGQKYFDEMSETLMKFRPKQGRIVSSNSRAPVPLAEDARPAAPPAVNNSTLHNAWIDNAEWLYGGVGFAGFNPSRAGGGCACWFSRYTLDHFARSFAPEPLHYSVAILDAGGNLITRVGRYGNVDSAGPESLVPLSGDEVGLFHACYVGTHTDRRLFISDVGNGRIVSVKLDYYVTETIALKTAAP